MEKCYTYLPFGKSGTGTYGESYSEFNDLLLSPLKNDILTLITRVPFPDKSKVFNIGDYGASDGAASMMFLKEVLICLKKIHGDEVEFQVIYEDLEVNDFNSLFRRLSGQIPEPPSFLKHFNNVFAMATGTSFYKQCVPSDSMHVIFCLASAHWLSKKPTIFKRSVNGFIDTSEEEKTLLHTQATSDWENFLLLRSKELKSGGLLIASISSRLENKTSSEETLSCGTFIKILNKRWKMFRDSGKVMEEEFLETNFGYYLFTLDQLKAPFLEQSSPVSMAGLKLLKSETFAYSMSAFTSWQRAKEEKGAVSREDFAKNYVQSHRCWSNSTFMSGLTDKRTSEEKMALVDEFYRDVEEEIKSFDPEKFRDELIMTCVIIQKL